MDSFLLSLGNQNVWCRNRVCRVFAAFDIRSSDRLSWAATWFRLIDNWASGVAYVKNSQLIRFICSCFLFSGLFWHFLCILFCGNDFCQLLKNIHFLTQLNTPPEYPEYSNRAFSLNTPGDPPSGLTPRQCVFLCNKIWLIYVHTTPMFTSCYARECCKKLMLLPWITPTLAH